MKIAIRFCEFTIGFSGFVDKQEAAAHRAIEREVESDVRWEVGTGQFENFPRWANLSSYSSRFANPLPVHRIQPGTAKKVELSIPHQLVALAFLSLIFVGCWSALPNRQPALSSIYEADVQSMLQNRTRIGKMAPRLD